MKLDDGVAWGNIVGGFAGLGSLFIVLIDKLRTRPRLVTSVRSATFNNYKSSPSQEGIRFFVNLEIGNVGAECTTITRVELRIQNGNVMQALNRESFSRMMIVIKEDERTRVCEKGMAFIERLEFCSNGGHSSDPQLRGELTLTLIGGRKHRQSVIFTNVKK